MREPVLQTEGAQLLKPVLIIKEAGDKILPSIQGPHNPLHLPQVPITEATAGII